MVDMWVMDDDDDCPQLSSPPEAGGSGEGGEIREREAKQELRLQSRTLPQVYLGQGCWMGNHTCVKLWKGEERKFKRIL